jgi:hypothetical protein
LADDLFNLHCFGDNFTAHQFGGGFISTNHAFVYCSKRVVV